jgi:diguanylate cyclase (GGDEF)-like protein
MTSILGIPDSEVTPQVHDALTTMLDEYDRVRFELDLRRERESYFKDLADRHSILPVLNRRAFLRELRVVLDHAEIATTVNSVVVFSLANGPEIRRRHGLEMAMRALAVVAESLARNLRASDVCGCLGGYDFGIVLTLAGGEPAAVKAVQLEAEIQRQWELGPYHRLPLALAWGLSTARPGDKAEALLEAADRNLLSRIPASLPTS